MPSKEWCGRNCAECRNPCKADELIACGLDCDELNEDGSRNLLRCVSCDAHRRDNKVWIRVGVTMRFDDDELESLATPLGEEIIRRKLMHWYDCEIDGETYIPDVDANEYLPDAIIGKEMYL